MVHSFIHFFIANKCQNYGGTQRPPPQKLTPLIPQKLTPLFPREFTGNEWSQFLGRWSLCATLQNAFAVTYD